MSAGRRRVIGLVLLAVVLAVGCTLAGRWQWNRHVVRDAEISTVEANFHSDPVPVSDLLPHATTLLSTGAVWTQVTATGQYLPAETVLLRNRPIGEVSGFHVIVPFRVTSSDGTVTVLVVDRGWIASGSDAQRPDQVPAPPSGTVTLTVHLRQDEPPSSRSAPTGQVQAIAINQVLETGGDPARAGTGAFSAYGSLGTEQPQAAQQIGALPEPSTDPGSHLSYAFQWWTFALGSLVGFGMMAVREERELRTGTGGRGPAPAPAPRTRRRPHRGTTAEDEEDALIEAQLGVTQASEMRSR